MSINTSPTNQHKQYNRTKRIIDREFEQSINSDSAIAIQITVWNSKTFSLTLRKKQMQGEQKSWRDQSTETAQKGKAGHSASQIASDLQGEFDRHWKANTKELFPINIMGKQENTSKDKTKTEHHGYNHEQRSCFENTLQIQTSCTEFRRIA